MNLRPLAWRVCLLGVAACGGSENAPGDDAGNSVGAEAGASIGEDGGSPRDSSSGADATLPDAAVDSGAHAPFDAGADAADSTPPVGPPGTFNVFDHIPQFNMYSSTTPANYTPPAGTLMWSYGTIFVNKLDAHQQSLIGSDLVGRLTYFAQCDNYDRIGGVFVVIEPSGQVPQPTDPRIELVRFITPFSDYGRGALATHVYPNADLSAFASVLADPTRDVWIGIGGGSYPTYPGNPCTNVAADAGSDFTEIGFSYSLDFISTSPRTPGATMAVAALSTASDAGPTASISNVPLTTTPIAGTFANPGSLVVGHVTVIVSGHGSASGGDEYEYTQDTVTAGGASVGSFSTQIDCSPYAAASPDGNPGIFQNNMNGNPRNWCPGALVPSHTFPVTLAAGSNSVVLGISPSQVPAGSYYQTSITFTAP